MMSKLISAAQARMNTKVSLLPAAIPKPTASNGRLPCVSKIRPPMKDLMLSSTSQEKMKAKLKYPLPCQLPNWCLLTSPRQPDETSSEAPKRCSITADTKSELPAFSSIVRSS